MSIKLREYQTEAIETVDRAIEDGMKRPAVVLPTGGGKTVVFSAMSALAIDKGLRPVILVHRDELARQAAAKLHAVAGIKAGIVKAQENDVHAPAVVASVQTLASRRRLEQLSPHKTLVIVDECHHATAASYMRALEYFGAFDDDSDSRAVGFTATMERGDGARLGEVWQSIVYQKDIPWMIRKGWLTDVKGVRLVVQDLDLAGVKMRAGDYSEGDVGAAIEASSSPEKVAEAYLEHARELPGILFAPTVETAHLFCEAFEKAGIKAATIHGAMPSDERRAVLAAYEAGHLQVLCNCMVLTEGFDSPRAQVVVIARPTTSAPLYIQMVGRVLRLFPGKTHALVIDVVGASALHALATLAKLSGRPLQALKENETLLEAIDALDEEMGSKVPIVYADGTVVASEVDLFHGSRMTWAQTIAGFWFIGTQERYLTLVPSTEPGAYDVAWFATRVNGLPKDARGGWLTQGVPDLALAMAYAEGAVTDDEYVLAMKGRQWRNRKASEKTIAMALRLGIDMETLPDLKGGTFSEAIGRVLASKRFDEPMTRYMRSKGLTH